MKLDFTHYTINVDIPTSKQIDFANKICSTLGLYNELNELPFTKFDYMKFINSHVEEFNKECSKVHSFKMTPRCRNSYSEDIWYEDGDWAAAMDFSWM